MTTGMVAVGADSAGSFESPTAHREAQGCASAASLPLGMADLCGASSDPLRLAPKDVGAEPCAPAGVAEPDYDDDDDAPPRFSTPLYRRAAATATVEERTSSKEGSFTGRLKNFAMRVFKKAATPLLPQPVADSSSTKIPHRRSRRIAEQPLSKIPVSQRGEVLIMQRLGFIQALSMEEGRQKLDEMFEGRPGDARAICELFPDEYKRRRTRRHRVSRE